MAGSIKLAHVTTGFPYFSLASYKPNTWPGTAIDNPPAAINYY